MTDQQPETEEPNSTRADGIATLLRRVDRRVDEVLDRVLPQWSDDSANGNAESVDPATVLDGVRSLEMRRWEYRDGDGTTHIGPMAEDFHETFGVGSDDRIVYDDARGVTLASVQALADELERRESTIDDLTTDLRNKESALDELETTLKMKTDRVDELAAENERLRERNDALERRLERLERRVASLDDASTREETS